jgi:hypothetical protein
MQDVGRDFKYGEDSAGKIQMENEVSFIYFINVNFLALLIELQLCKMLAVEESEYMKTLCTISATFL